MFKYEVGTSSVIFKQVVRRWSWISCPDPSPNHSFLVSISPKITTYLDFVVSHGQLFGSILYDIYPSKFPSPLLVHHRKQLRPFQ